MLLTRAAARRPARRRRQLCRRRCPAQAADEATVSVLHGVAGSHRRRLRQRQGPVDQLRPRHAHRPGQAAQPAATTSRSPPPAPGRAVRPSSKPRASTCLRERTSPSWPTSPRRGRPSSPRSSTTSSAVPAGTGAPDRAAHGRRSCRRRARERQAGLHRADQPEREVRRGAGRHGERRRRARRNVARSPSARPSSPSRRAPTRSSTPGAAPSRTTSSSRSRPSPVCTRPPAACRPVTAARPPSSRLRRGSSAVRRARRRWAGPRWRLGGGSRPADDRTPAAAGWSPSRRPPCSVPARHTSPAWRAARPSRSGMPSPARLRRLPTRSADAGPGPLAAAGPAARRRRPAAPSRVPHRPDPPDGGPARHRHGRHAAGSRPLGADGRCRLTLPWPAGTASEPAPASESGAVVLAAHVDSRAYGVGPFARLAAVRAGDEVSVDAGVGTMALPGRPQVERETKTAVDLAQLFATDGPPRLHLVTCTGRYDRVRRVRGQPGGRRRTGPAPRTGSEMDVAYRVGYMTEMTQRSVAALAEDLAAGRTTRSPSATSAGVRSCTASPLAPWATAMTPRTSPSRSSSPRGRAARRLRPSDAGAAGLAASASPVGGSPTSWPAEPARRQDAQAAGGRSSRASTTRPLDRLVDGVVLRHALDAAHRTPAHGAGAGLRPGPDPRGDRGGSADAARHGEEPPAARTGPSATDSWRRRPMTHCRGGPRRPRARRPRGGLGGPRVTSRSCPTCGADVAELRRVHRCCGRRLAPTRRSSWLRTRGCGSGSPHATDARRRRARRRRARLGGRRARAGRRVAPRRSPTPARLPGRSAAGAAAGVLPAAALVCVLAGRASAGWCWAHRAACAAGGPRHRGPGRPRRLAERSAGPTCSSRPATTELRISAAAMPASPGYRRGVADQRRRHADGVARSARHPEGGVRRATSCARPGLPHRRPVPRALRQRRPALR